MWSGKDLRRIRLRRKYIYIRKWTRFVKKKERIANEKFHLVVRSFLHQNIIRHISELITIISVARSMPSAVICSYGP